MSRTRRQVRKPPSTSRQKRSDRLHRILVVSEGALTEPEYFELLNRHIQHTLPPHADKIQIKVDPKTKDGKARRKAKNNPMDVVDRCILLRDDDARKNNSKDIPKYAAVFAVVDVDQWDDVRRGSGNTSLLAKALSKAKDHGIHVLVSNPQFETWLVLHTECTPAGDQQGLDRQCRERSLLKGKNIHDDFPIDQYKRAAERAKEHHHVGVNQIGPKGSTGLFHLVDTISKWTCLDR